MEETNSSRELRYPWEPDEMLLFIRAFDDRLCKISGKKKQAKFNEISELLRARGEQLGYELYPAYRSVRSIENLFYAAKRYLKDGTSDGVHPLLKDCLDLYVDHRDEFDRRVSAIPPIQVELTESKESSNSSSAQKIGHYGAVFKLKEVSKKKAEILKQLRQNYSRISDYKLEKAEKQSWAASIDTIKQAYRQLDPSFGELDVVMEYVMPRHKPGSAKSEGEHSIRTDAVLVSSKTVLVLEFKQRDTSFEEGFVKQAGKYQTRLKRYHSGSKEMIIKSVLVLTKAENHLKSFGAVASCSADKLSDALALMFEPAPQPHDDIDRWINAGFVSD